VRPRGRVGPRYVAHLSLLAVDVDGRFLSFAAKKCGRWKKEERRKLRGNFGERCQFRPLRAKKKVEKDFLASFFFFTHIFSSSERHFFSLFARHLKVTFNNNVASRPTRVIVIVTLRDFGEVPFYQAADSLTTGDDSV